MLRSSLRLVVLVLVGVPFWLSCNGGGNGPTAPSGPKTGEEFCATLPSIGTGHAFFCGTTQGNLQHAGGFQGFCQYTHENLGLVGYCAVTYSGGVASVETQAEASQLCFTGLAGQCPGYIRCTRLP